MLGMTVGWRKVLLNNASIQDNILLSSLIDNKGYCNWSFIKSKVHYDIVEKIHVLSLP